MKLYIKNMVCNRCKMVVNNTLVSLGLTPVKVELGEVEIKGDIDKTQRSQVDEALQEFGFTLINDRKSRIIEQVKNLVIELVQQDDAALKTNLSDHISRKIQQEYTYISNLFTQVEGTTIEQYFIAQKIEKVKELLVYDELTLSEIAFRMHYSSVAHLSKQFKKVTGLTPSHFKKLRDIKRTPLEEL